MSITYHNLLQHNQISLGEIAFGVGTVRRAGFVMSIGLMACELGGATTQIHFASCQSSLETDESHLSRNRHRVWREQAVVAGNGVEQKQGSTAARQQLGPGQTSTGISLQENHSAADSDFSHFIPERHGPASATPQRCRSRKARFDYGI